MKKKIIYFDNSATMPAHQAVIEEVTCAMNSYYANPNAHHELGAEALGYISKATSNIARALGVDDEEIIYTSSASEANNTVLNMIGEKYRHQGRHIITSVLEHPSMVSPLAVLQKQGFIIDMIGFDSKGQVDEAHFKKLLELNPVLVSVISVESETGWILPIERLAYLTKQHSHAFFHTDMTQAFMKVETDLKDVDYATLSSHKIGGPKGVGILVKKKSSPLIPLIYGGHSTTKYRASTPTTELIGGFSKAIEVMKKYRSQSNTPGALRTYLKTELNKLGFTSNEFEKNSPYILNVSYPHLHIEKFYQLMSARGAYFSLRSACSSHEGFSQSVFALSGSMENATHCFRLSFSDMNTIEEAQNFVEWTKEVIEECL